MVEGEPRGEEPPLSQPQEGRPTKSLAASESQSQEREPQLTSDKQNRRPSGSAIPGARVDDWTAIRAIFDRRQGRNTGNKQNLGREEDSTLDG